MHREPRPATRLQQAPRRAVARRKPGKTDLTRIAAAVLGVLVVCSLLGAALGVAVFDRAANSDEDGSEEEVSSTEYEDSLRERIAAEPEDVESMLSLATLLATEGDLREAVTWYERALTIDPDNVKVRLSFANALAVAGERADAEVQYQKVLAVEPENTDVHFYRAELYRQWEPPRIDEAVRDYRKVIELDAASYLAERAAEELRALGAAATPVATPGPPLEGTP